MKDYFTIKASKSINITVLYNKLEVVYLRNRFRVIDKFSPVSMGNLPICTSITHPE